MRSVTIAVLGKFPDIFDGFVESADKFLPDIPKVFVRDGSEITMPTGPKWTCLQGPPVFSNPATRIKRGKQRLQTATFYTAEMMYGSFRATLGRRYRKWHTQTRK